MQPILCIATGGSCIRLRPLGDPLAQGGLWIAPWQGTEMLDGARIHRLTAQPGERDGARSLILAASWGEGLWFSRDGARRWSNAGVDIQGSRVHCAAASSTGEFFVGSDHAILKRARADLRRWELLDNLWLVPSSSAWGARGGAVLDVAVNPRHEEWLLAAIGGAGVLFSSDGGFSWDDARPGSDPATRRLLWHPDSPTQALALAPNSLKLSDDGGWSWEDAGFPLDNLLAATSLPEGQWLVAARGPRARGGRCELWRGDGREWLLASRFEPREAGPQVPADAATSSGAACVESVLAVREEDSAGAGEAWLLGWSDGAVEVSTEGGRSWRPLLIDGARPERARDMVLCMAPDEPEEGDAEAQASAQAEDESGAESKKAPEDERGGVRFSVDRKIWSSLLDKGRGRT